MAGGNVGRARYNKSLILGMVVVSVYVGYFGAGGVFWRWRCSAFAGA